MNYDIPKNNKINKKDEALDRDSLARAYEKMENVVQKIFDDKRFSEDISTSLYSLVVTIDDLVLDYNKALTFLGRLRDELIKETGELREQNMIDQLQKERIDKAFNTINAKIEQLKEEKIKASNQPNELAA